VGGGLVRYVGGSVEIKNTLGGGTLDSRPAVCRWAAARIQNSLDGGCTL